MQVYTIQRNGAFIVTFLAPADKYNDSLPTIQAMIDSITEISASSPAPAPSSGRVIFATNSGGPAYTGVNGISYQADIGYSGGNTARRGDSIANTDDDTIYQSQRYGDFSYAIPLSNGEYEVTFKFAEIGWTTANTRIFDVKVEGVKVIIGLDIYGKVGHDVAYDVTVNARVTDELLNIEFITIKDNAECSAIVVSKR
jgi:hypothetical protein